MQIISTFNEIFHIPNQCMYVLETGTTRFGISKANDNIWIPSSYYELITSVQSFFLLAKFHQKINRNKKKLILEVSSHQQ
jgi:hypothetical protein